MTNPLFPTALQARQLITFYDPVNTGNTYSPNLNPGKIARSPSNVRKWVGTINGASLVVGQSELPPKEISFSWSQVDISVFKTLAPFTDITPLVFVDNNDNGFLGSLVLDAPEQLAGLSSNVWALKGSFMVVSPYNGLHSTILQLAVPTLSVGTSTTGGYIAGGSNFYVWATVWTPSGESTPGSATNISIPSGTNTNVATLSWTAPASNNYRRISLYWNTTNNSSTATWITDIWAGQTQTWTFFTGVIPYSTKNPPLYTRAFDGQWAGGLWIPN